LRLDASGKEAKVGVAVSLGLEEGALIVIGLWNNCKRLHRKAHD
jgi:hypothetical protein